MVTSFFDAIASGPTTLVESMIRAGAEVNAPMPMPGAGAPRMPLWVAAAAGRAEVARLLIRYKADVNATTPDGQTALGAAIMKGDWDVFSILLDAGAKVDIRFGKDSWTPLIRAAANGRTRMVSALLQRGAEVDALTANGWTAL